MNTVTVTTLEPPFAVLPNQINIDPNKYYKSTRDTCYWANETCHDEYLINQFIIKAREFNYTEEQALAVLTYNHYDFEKSECDLHIYRPIKGLAKVDVKQIVKIISDGIGKTVKTREHRDFDDILLLFPGFTIGDVLGAYSKHRFLIKKQTYRVKKSFKKSITKPYIINGNLKDNESIWNESCLDTQFQMVYQKHFQLIQNCNNIHEIISRDLSDMKQTNKNGIKLAEPYSYFEADGMLNLLRKMNRKRNKLGSALDKTQLLSIFNSICNEKISRTQEDMNFVNPSPCMSTPSTSPNADITSTSSKEPVDDNHFEEKLHDYVKGNMCQSKPPDESDFEVDKVADSLKNLLEQHETVLNSFKNYLPGPNKFQQLSHSWDNMDFSILLLSLSEYGKDFNKTADAVFTKSESMIHSFYLTYNPEFNFNDILPQPTTENDGVDPSTAEEPEELISEESIKIEEFVDSSLCPVVSIESLDNQKSCNKKKLTNTNRSSKKFKNPSSTSSIHFTEDNSNLIVTRSLRSRIEMKEIMKTLIDQDKTPDHRKSKKNLKRTNPNFIENHEPKTKSNRKV